MGDPVLRWVPDGESATESAAITRQVSVFQGGRNDVAESSISVGGKAVSVVEDSYDMFEVELKGINPTSSAVFFSDLWSWWGHAGRGGEFEFGLDSADTLNTTTSAASTQGDTTISLTSVSTLAVGDWIMIEDADDPTKAERRRVTAISSLDVGVNAGITYGFGAGSTVRHAEFFPSCVVLSTKMPFTERDAGRGGRLWDLKFSLRTVR